MLKDLILPYLLVAALVSCSSEDKEDLLYIQVEVASSEDLSIDEISNRIEGTSLELSENSLVGVVLKVEFTSEYLFVLDAVGPNIHQFDRDGNFIRRVGNYGEGPGEYKYLNTFTVDANSKSLFAAAGGKVIEFDFNGELIDEFKFDSFIEFADSCLHLYVNDIGIPHKDGKFKNVSRRYSIDERKQILDTLLLKEVLLNSVKGFSYPKAKYRSNSRKGSFLYYPVLLNEPVFRDTLYTIVDHRLKPILRLDFGSLGQVLTGKNR